MSAPAQVLVIEDDSDTARLFVDVLADAGLSAVSCAHDRLPERDSLSMVVTDLTIGPRSYSGPLAREWVSLLRDRYGAPVVVVTGHAEASVDRELRPLTTAIIEKPVDIDDLLTAIRGGLTYRT